MQSEEVPVPFRPISDDVHLGLPGKTVAMHPNQEVPNSIVSSLNYINANNFVLYRPSLNNLEAQSMAPTKRFIRQDSVCQSNSSSHNSAMDEAEEQQVIDERKQRRMISNRESARRSRMRKQKHLDELRAQVARMRAENRQLMNKFDIFSQHYNQIIEENHLLRSQKLDLNQKLQQFQETVNAAQAAFALKVLGFDDLPCTAAHLRKEPNQHLAKSLISSDLLH